MVNMEELAVLARWVLQDNGDYDNDENDDYDDDGDDDFDDVHHYRCYLARSVNDDIMLFCWLPC